MIDLTWKDDDGLDFNWIDSTVNWVYLSWRVAVHLGDQLRE